MAARGAIVVNATVPNLNVMSKVWLKQHQGCLKLVPYYGGSTSPDFLSLSSVHTTLYTCSPPQAHGITILAEMASGIDGEFAAHADKLDVESRLLLTLARTFTARDYIAALKVSFANLSLL